MPVYLIRAGEHGPVKIGHTDNLPSRLSKMQIDNHERLTVLRIFAGAEAEEAALHLRFDANWLHGEWFSFTTAMLGDVGLVEIITEPATETVEDFRVRVDAIPNLGARIKAWRVRAGLSQRAVASALGVAPSAVAQWETDITRPSLTNLRGIAALFKTTLDALLTEAA